jgi:hypothetical protein
VSDLFSRAEAPPPRPAPARRTDPDTSHKAGKEVAAAVPTMREQVLAFALEAGEGGFIDEELVNRFLGSPESSYRKRRSELSQERWIIDTGGRRQNSFGNEEIVWVHRDFIVQPAPLLEREQAAARDKLAADGRAMAAKLATYGKSMMKEGRAMFAAELADAARLMAALAGKPPEAGPRTGPR